MNYLIKTGDFSLGGNYLRPSNNSRQLIFNINAVVLIVINYHYQNNSIYVKIYENGKNMP